MPAPWNSSSACLRAPREIHISDSAAYFTGVARSDRIGGGRLNLLNRGHAIPLGVRSFFKKGSHKAPSTHNEGGAFFLFLPREIKSIFHRGGDYFTGASCGQKQRESIREEFGNS